MEENPLYFGRVKRFKAFMRPIIEQLPYWIAVGMLSLTCVGVGVLGTIFFQNFRLQNPVIIKYQCFVCRLTPSPTPTKKVEIKAKGIIIHKFNASGESKLIK